MNSSFFFWEKNSQLASFVYVFICYSELAGVVEINDGAGAGGEEQSNELAGGDEDEAGEDEGAIAMANDPELAADAEMLSQNLRHVRRRAPLHEHSGKVLQPEDLQVAHQPKQDADEQEECHPIDPTGQLQGAGHHVADRHAPGDGERNPLRPRGIPPDLVDHLSCEAGHDEERQQAEGTVELVHVARSHPLALPHELVEEEEAAEAIPADESWEADEGEGRGGGEGELNRHVVGAAAWETVEDEVGRGGHEDAEQEEDGPRHNGMACVGLVDAHPTKAGAEHPELVVRPGEAAEVRGRLARKQRLGAAAARVSVPHHFPRWVASVAAAPIDVMAVVDKRRYIHPGSELNKKKRERMDSEAQSPVSCYLYLQKEKKSCFYKDHSIITIHGDCVDWNTKFV